MAALAPASESMAQRGDGDPGGQAQFPPVIVRDHAADPGHPVMEVELCFGQGHPVAAGHPGSVAVREPELVEAGEIRPVLLRHPVAARGQADPVLPVAHVAVDDGDARREGRVVPVLAVEDLHHAREGLGRCEAAAGKPLLEVRRAGRGVDDEHHRDVATLEDTEGIVEVTLGPVTLAALNRSTALKGATRTGVETAR
jgi:hypothetical protein